VTDFRQLVEARIRDFRAREKAGETRPAPETTEQGSLETALVAEIRALRASARAEKDAHRAQELRTRARSLETQLFVLLESTGRPLMAKVMADRLRSEQ
jgi:hypothetical protein